MQPNSVLGVKAALSHKKLLSKLTEQEESSSQGVNNRTEQSGKEGSNGYSQSNNNNKHTTGSGQGAIGGGKKGASGSYYYREKSIMNMSISQGKISSKRLKEGAADFKYSAQGARPKSD